MALSIWVIDPANMTPYYNLALCHALSDAGCQGRYVSAQYLYDQKLPSAGNFKIDYLYFRGLNRRWLLNYPRLRRAARALAYPFGHVQLLNQIRRVHPDIVHIQWNRLPRLDAILARVIHQIGCPLIYTVHDINPLFEKNSITHSLGLLYEKADALIVHTEANRQNFLKIYPHIAPDLITVIPHIELRNAFIPEYPDPHQARLDLGLPADAFIYLFIGSIRAYKGVDILLKAFSKLELSPMRHLVIAGRPDGPEDASILAPYLQHPHISIMPQYIPHEAVWKYYSAADVVVFPYRHIYQSGALITAMGFGKAVIATQVGGLPETVDGNGWLVPPENPEQLAKVMLEAATDHDRIKQMGRQSLTLIAERYAENVVANKHLAVYNEVLNRFKTKHKF